MSTRDVIKVEVRRNNNIEFIRYASYLDSLGPNSRYALDDGGTLIAPSNLSVEQLATQILNR